MFLNFVQSILNNYTIFRLVLPGWTLAINEKYVSIYEVFTHLSVYFTCFIGFYVSIGFHRSRLDYREIRSGTEPEQLYISHTFCFLFTYTPHYASPYTFRASR